MGDIGYKQFGAIIFLALVVCPLVFFAVVIPVTYILMATMSTSDGGYFAMALSISIALFVTVLVAFFSYKFFVRKAEESVVSHD